MDLLLIKMGLKILLGLLVLFNFFELKKASDSQNICLCIYQGAVYIASVILLVT